MIGLWNIALGIAILLTWPIAIPFAIIFKHGLFCRLGFVPRPRNRCVWIHASSVGEVGVSASIRDMIREIDPEVDVFMSAVTKMGLRRLKSICGPRDKYCAFPLDFRPFIWNAFRRVEPDLLIVVETEFWANFLTEAKKRNIPAILVNGRISISTLSWALRFPKTFHRISSCFDVFLMKSEADAKNLESTGVSREKIKVIGNLKFAGVPKNVKPIGTFSRPTIVFGSARPNEFSSIAKACVAVKAKFQNALFIVAPRHLNTVASARTELEAQGLKTIRRTTASNPNDADVYLIDTIGELLGFYSVADVTFVGGTLADYGGHNPLEPAFFAKPVIFGPFNSSNREAYELLLQGNGAIEVKDWQELADAIISILDEPERGRFLGERAKSLVDEMKGITDKYNDIIKEYIS